MKIIQRIKDALRGEQNLDKLIRRGLKVGARLKRMGGVIIDPSHCWHITIGDDVTLAPRVHILAHDASTFTHIGYTKVENVQIGHRVFVGASAIIMPGVTIGDNAIIGAGSIVTKDVSAGMVAVGCPAKVVCTTEEYIRKEEGLRTEKNSFGEDYTVRGGITKDKKNEMVAAAAKYGRCYVK